MCRRCKKWAYKSRVRHIAKFLGHRAIEHERLGQSRWFVLLVILDGKLEEEKAVPHCRSCCSVSLLVILVGEVEEKNNRTLLALFLLFVNRVGQNKEIAAAAPPRNRNLYYYYMARVDAVDDVVKSVVNMHHMCLVDRRVDVVTVYVAVMLSDVVHPVLVLFVGSFRIVQAWPRLRQTNFW